jgi:ribosomal-protein-alanine N-acetyltransferase
MAARMIREMRETDIDEILEIERLSFPTPWTDAMFKHQLSLDKIAASLSLVEEGTVVGYAIAWFVFDEIHLLSIAVAPHWRRRGYAGRLLDAVIEMGRERGIYKIVLEVRVGNTGAQEFYRRRGFRVIGRRKGYYRETGEDAIIMEYVFDE